MSYTATIDVPGIEAGLDFYGGVLGFREVARPIPDYAILELDGQRLGLMRKEAGTRGTPAEGTERRYVRHWTPIHLDFHVEDLNAVLKDVERLGGTCEGLHDAPGHRAVAFCSDPFGHGFCLIGPRAGA